MIHEDYFKLKTGDIIATKDGIKLVFNRNDNLPHKTILDSPTHEFAYTISPDSVIKVIENICDDCLVKLTCIKAKHIHKCFSDRVYPYNKLRKIK